MGVNRGPNPIITDGLVFAVDAGNTRCYTSGSTTATDLVFDNTLTLTNGSAPAIQPFSNSWELDGTDDYMSTATPFTSDADRTVSLWINPDDYDVTTHNPRVMFNWDSADEDIQMILKEAGGFKWGSNDKNTGIRYDTPPAVSTWTNVVGTVSGDQTDINNWNLYFNAVLTAVSADNRPGLGSPNVDTCRFGATAQSSATGFYDGKIGCILIYNRALSQAEILQNYNAQKSRFGL